jgi:hypothetical protein
VVILHIRHTSRLDSALGKLVPRSLLEESAAYAPEQIGTPTA